jgi:hypothetical protein
LAAFARLDVEHRLVFNLMAREIARTELKMYSYQRDLMIFNVRKVRIHNPDLDGWNPNYGKNWGWWILLLY